MAHRDLSKPPKVELVKFWVFCLPIPTTKSADRSQFCVTVFCRKFTPDARIVEGVSFSDRSQYANGISACCTSEKRKKLRECPVSKDLNAPQMLDLAPLCCVLCTVCTIPCSTNPSITLRWTALQSSVRDFSSTHRTSTLSQRKGRAPQPSITFSCQAGGGGGDG